MVPTVLQFVPFVVIFSTASVIVHYVRKYLRGRRFGTLERPSDR